MSSNLVAGQNNVDHLSILNIDRDRLGCGGKEQDTLALRKFCPA